MPRPLLTMDVHLDPAVQAGALGRDARLGLTSRPKQLAPKWFYDERGSQLFDAITTLPEYYLTRCEQQILGQAAAAIAALTGAERLVELGSGTSTKTRVLLDALAGAGTLAGYVAFDVSEATLRAASSSIAAAYPGLEVHGVVGDFEHHLDRLPTGGGQLVAFLGSTIGNLSLVQRMLLMTDLTEVMAPGDWLLLGTDLVKDPERLVAAYDDAAGVTAEFNRNLLHVLNRELDADFCPGQFTHVARWDPAQEHMAMSLRAGEAQEVTLRALELRVSFEPGEEMLTETSAKFRRANLESELGGAGLELARWWTDAAGDFGLSLWRRQ